GGNGMSTRFREDRPLARHVAGLLAGAALAATLPAATPEPLLTELDEVLVIGEVPLPLEDYVAYPQFDSVVVSPGGRHLATAWGSNWGGAVGSGLDLTGGLGIVDLPSLHPRS